MSLFPVYDRTPQQVAARVGVDEKTVRRWCNLSVDDDYPCPHQRDERGRLLLNDYQVDSWMERVSAGEVGGQDRVQQWAAKRAADGFWRLDIDFPPLRIPRDPALSPVAVRDRTKCPDPICTAFERGILTGVRTMTVEDVKAYVEGQIAFRAILWDRFASEPDDEILHNKACDAVYRQSYRETATRLRAIVACHVDGLAAAIDRIRDRQDGIERDDDGNPIQRTPSTGRVSRSTRAPGTPDEPGGNLKTTVAERATRNTTPASPANKGRVL